MIPNSFRKWKMFTFSTSSFHSLIWLMIRSKSFWIHKAVPLWLRHLALTLWPSFSWNASPLKAFSFIPIEPMRSKFITHPIFCDHWKQLGPKLVPNSSPLPNDQNEIQLDWEEKLISDQTWKAEKRRKKLNPERPKKEKWIVLQFVRLYFFHENMTQNVISDCLATRWAKTRF